MAKKSRFADDGSEKEDLRDPYLVEIGRRIKEARVQKGMSQRDLGDRANRMSPGSIYLIEYGRQNITVVALKSIADALEMPIEDLVSDPTSAFSWPERAVSGLAREVETLQRLVQKRLEEEGELTRRIERVPEALRELVKHLKPPGVK